MKTIPTFILFELTTLRRASATYSVRGTSSCSDIVGREAFVQLSSRLYAWADLVECAILLQNAPHVFQASLQKTRDRNRPPPTPDDHILYYVLVSSCPHNCESTPTPRCCVPWSNLVYKYVYASIVTFKLIRSAGEADADGQT